MIATALENTKTAWLGEFPAHWEVLRIKNLFQEMDSRSETGSEELLSVSHYTGVTLKRESLENEDDHLTNAESLVGYKLVQQGDLVINIMLAWNGSLGISPYNGITSPAYCVYRIKGDNNPEYFGYLFTTNLFKAEFRRHSTGIIDSRLRLYSDKFFSIFTIVPPKDEQDEIVQYIKAQEEKINLFIQKKQRFIELLKEQRLSIVNNYVTSETKNWIWLRLKDIVTVNDEALTEKTEDDFLIRYIDIGNVNSYGDIAEIQEYEFKDAPSRARRIVRKGDVIISTVRTYLKAITLIESDEDNLIASTGFAVLRPKENVLSEYLNFALRAEYFISSVIQNSYGVSYPAINSSTLSSLKIVIPKSTSEQQEIINKIKTETATIDTAIAKAEREIELIREYKEAMIAEAVMGKRKLNFAH
ncbi:MAG: restriction endonuclease subunit S [Chlorobi bacterium]|nr:restriction endonuclease subunit S [Chlorobiota bacterium]NOG68575.1 restriction endonuclease subunit S [Chlorobiota bacterium]